MRIGLLVQRFALPASLEFGDLYTPDFPRLMAGFAPARTVPALKLPDGTVVCESLAIAEELASRFPDAGLWPADPSARALARGLAAEMHAGFGPLRQACPMNLRRSYVGFAASEAVRADLARIEELWAFARRASGAEGPWLFGDYSLADVFFAPVATRIATYGLPVGEAAGAYVAAHLADPAFLEWRRAGLAERTIQPGYDLDLPARPWPGPA